VRIRLDTHHLEHEAGFMSAPTNSVAIHWPLEELDPGISPDQFEHR
jgi:hypothetical protein